MDIREDIEEFCTRRIARAVYNSINETEQPNRQDLDWAIAEEYLARPECQPHIDHLVKTFPDIPAMSHLREMGQYVTLNLWKPFVEYCCKKISREPGVSWAIHAAVRHFAIVTIAEKIHAHLASELEGDERALQDWLAAERAVDVCEALLPAIERTARITDLYRKTCFMCAYGKQILQAAYYPMIQSGLPDGYMSIRDDVPRYTWEIEIDEQLSLPLKE